MPTSYNKQDWFFLYAVLVACLVVLFTSTKVRCLELEEPLPICPVDFHECIERDFVAELQRAHMLDPSLHPIGTRLYDGISDRRRQIDDWELEAIQIVGSGVIGKGYLDLLETDDGAHGFAHFQPPNGLDIPRLAVFEAIDELEDIRWIDNPKWVQEVDEVLHGPYSVAIQLRAWRDGVNHAVRGAARNGWEEDQYTIAAAIANSTGEWGFLELAEHNEWCPTKTIDGYVAQRPDSLHRQRRARRLQEFL